jgi:putative NADH-flavin reductase
MAGRLCVLGGTGDTGRRFVEQALTAGYHVNILVRNASRVDMKNPNLTISTGSVFDASDIEQACRGSDVVVSTLGFQKQEGKVTDFTDSMKAILEGMQRANINRIVTISAWYTNPTNRAGQPLFDNFWSKFPGLPNTLDNEGEMEEMLRATSDHINFTSVRVSSLTWDDATDKDFVVNEGNWVENVPGGGAFISRADVARFMLSVVGDPLKYRRKEVAIAIPMSETELAEAQQRHSEHFEKCIKGTVTTH